MAVEKTVVAGSDVTALQLKDFFRQIADGSLSGNHVQALLEHRNPFVEVSRGGFNPSTFIGKGWELTGSAKALPEGWSPKMLRGVSALKSTETFITGKETKKRLKDHLLLGVNAFWLCWNNQRDIPEELKGKIILFDGDELRSPRGTRYSLCLHWSGGQWRWSCYWLDDGRYSDYLSALAS